MPGGITDVGELLNNIIPWLMAKPYRCRTRSVRHLSVNRGICSMYIEVVQLRQVRALCVVDG